MICDFTSEQQSDGTFKHTCKVCGAVRKSATPLYYRRCGHRRARWIRPVWSYLRELAKWAAAGFPCRPQAEIDRIFDTMCQPCVFYKPSKDGEGTCGKCGCKLAKKGQLRNKIKFGTTSCPLGKW